MFARRFVSVEPGDIFSEARPAKKSFFQALSITKRVGDGCLSDGFDDPWADHWRVAELLTFNDLPHAKLTHCGNGRQRIIALDALAQSNIYRKRKRPV